ILAFSSVLRLSSFRPTLSDKFSDEFLIMVGYHSCLFDVHNGPLQTSRPPLIRHFQASDKPRRCRFHGVHRRITSASSQAHMYNQCFVAAASSQETGRT